MPLWRIETHTVAQYLINSSKGTQDSDGDLNIKCPRMKKSRNKEQILYLEQKKMPRGNIEMLLLENNTLKKGHRTYIEILRINRKSYID